MRKIQTKQPKREKTKQCAIYLQQTKVKRGKSGLDIDGNVRLERRGTLVARNIEVKVNQKKRRNSVQDVQMPIKVNEGMLSIQDISSGCVG